MIVIFPESPQTFLPGVEAKINLDFDPRYFLKFRFHFPQNPGPCRIPGHGQLSKVKSRPPGQFFELIPGGCTQFKLTET